MANAAIRQEAGVEAPRAGTYTIDPAHSSVAFSARHLMVSKVRGAFGEFSGSLAIGEQPHEAEVRATILAASITTHNDGRDGHLRSPDFLDVERYPTIEFRSTGVEHTRGAALRLDGELTIRGVSRPVTLEVDYLGAFTDTAGNDRAAFSARGEIDREAFGITWNQALEAGGVLVGRRVGVELEIAAIREPEQ